MALIVNNWKYNIMKCTSCKDVSAVRNRLLCTQCADPHFNANFGKLKYVIKDSDLTADQSKALNAVRKSLLKQFKGKDEGRVTQITGQAGTGKSFIIRKIANILKVKILAPTNKACSILRDKLHSVNATVNTIHSFLRGNIEYSSSGEERFKFVKTTEFKDHIIIVDEASMVDKTAYNALMQTGAFIVTFGDQVQLPPVKEKISLFYENHPINDELTENIRNTNDMYNQMLTEIRNGILDKFELPSTVAGVKKYLNKYIELIRFNSKIKDIVSQFDSDQDNPLILAYQTNARNTVGKLNRCLRRHRYSENDQPYLPGEILIATKTFVVDYDYDKMINACDELLVIDVACETVTVDDEAYTCWRLQVDDHEITVIDPKDKAKYINNFNKARNELRQQISDNKPPLQIIDGMWEGFYKRWTKNNAPIDYGYALSIHKSQGSTSNGVYMNLGDFSWLIKKDPKFFYQLVYTALSRTRAGGYYFI